MTLFTGSQRVADKLAVDLKGKADLLGFRFLGLFGAHNYSKIRLWGFGVHDLRCRVRRFGFNSSTFGLAPEFWRLHCCATRFRWLRQVTHKICA